MEPQNTVQVLESTFKALELLFKDSSYPPCKRKAGMTILGYILNQPGRGHNNAVTISINKGCELVGTRQKTILNKLVKDGILCRDNYIIKQKSYIYWLSLDTQISINHYLAQEQLRTIGVVALPSGQLVKYKPASQKLYDANRHSYSELLQQTLKTLNVKVEVDVEAVEQFLKDTFPQIGIETLSPLLRSDFVDWQLANAIHNEGKQKKHTVEGTKALFENCFRAYEELVKASGWYTPTYSVATTSRLMEQGAAVFQGSTRKLKHVIFNTMNDSQKVFNYDIKSCQAYLLLKEFRYCGINCQWLEDYASGVTSKEYYADTMGVDLDTWKALMYSLYFLAPIPKHCAIVENAIATLCWEFVSDEIGSRTGQSLEDANLYLRTFKELVADLVVALAQWHEALYSDKYIGNKKWAKNPLKPNRLTCALGTTFDVEMPKQLALKQQELRRLAAFILQSQESHYIAIIIALASKYDYAILSQQHDGVITRGLIPQAAMDEAASITEFEAQLIVKPYY